MNRTITPGVLLNDSEILKKTQLITRKNSKPASTRISAIDWARGVAVSLMILSHGVKGLLSFEQFEPWGLVPIHLITKFSSSLFILVFGISMAVAYLPAVGTEAWPKKRKKLFLRGLVILFWYKVLTIVEMFSQNEPAKILNTLAYNNFPSYVEILGFYGLAFLWLPFFLSFWKKWPSWLQFAFPILLIGVSQWFRHHVDLDHRPILEALINEHEDYYTWGQLARAPLIFAGLLLGVWLKDNYAITWKRIRGAAALLTVSGIFFLSFYLQSTDTLPQSLMAIALNEGKHPPETGFMLFSIFGALLILAIGLIGGEKLAYWMKPITIIGRDSLQAFIFHIFVIFVFYRHLFGLWQKISYEQALTLTLVLLAMTAIWIKVRMWILKESS